MCSFFSAHFGKPIKPLSSKLAREQGNEAHQVMKVDSPIGIYSLLPAKHSVPCDRGLKYSIARLISSRYISVQCQHRIYSSHTQARDKLITECIGSFFQTMRPHSWTMRLLCQLVTCLHVTLPGHSTREGGLTSMNLKAGRDKTGSSGNVRTLVIMMRYELLKHAPGMVQI